MTFKADWTTDPAELRAATPIPSLFTRRDYGIIAALYLVILILAFAAN